LANFWIPLAANLDSAQPYLYSVYVKLSVRVPTEKMEMLLAKRGRPDYRTDVQRERDALNKAKRKSKATRPTDAARRNALQVAAMEKKDSELPELQEDLETVNYICRYSDPKSTGDRDLKLITWQRRECGVCYDKVKDARFVTSEAAANKGEDLCPHAFCWDCATAHVFGAAAISARTPQYQRTPLARCPVCNVEVTGVVKVEFKADSGM